MYIKLSMDMCKSLHGEFVLLTEMKKNEECENLLRAKSITVLVTHATMYRKKVLMSYLNLGEMDAFCFYLFILHFHPLNGTCTELTVKKGYQLMGCSFTFAILCTHLKIAHQRLAKIPCSNKHCPKNFC